MPATNRRTRPAPRWRHETRHHLDVVIRVRDPETGISKPRWVGGFATDKTPRPRAPSCASAPARPAHPPKLDDPRLLTLSSGSKPTQ